MTINCMQFIWCKTQTTTNTLSILILIQIHRTYCTSDIWYYNCKHLLFLPFFLFSHPSLHPLLHTFGFTSMRDNINLHFFWNCCKRNLKIINSFLLTFFVEWTFTGWLIVACFITHTYTGKTSITQIHTSKKTQQDWKVKVRNINYNDTNITEILNKMIL